MIVELERRTREEFFGDDAATHLDYAELWVASGKTLLDLAKSISGATGLHVMYESLRRYLLSQAENAAERLANARARGAHPLVEEALATAEGAEQLDKDQIPAAKLLTDTRLRVAEMWNRAELGTKAGVSVTVNVAGMHLDALRQRPAVVAVEPDLALESGANAPDYEIVTS